MTDPFLLLAAERQRDLQRDAARSALVRLAVCCRPGALRRALSAAHTHLDALVTRGRREPCCA